MKRLLLFINVILLVANFSCTQSDDEDGVAEIEDLERIEINLTQNSTSIPSGTGTYPFGDVTLEESSSVVAFSIENTSDTL